MPAHDSTEAIQHFKKHDPVLHKAALPFYDEVFKAVSHRRRYDSLLASLFGSIVSQQLSTKAADTIWGRLVELLEGDVCAERIAALPVAALRQAGLSEAKAKALQDISAHYLDGRLNFRRVAKADTEAAIAELVALRGVGVWTAEMFLIFALGRTDVFSVRDLGLRRSMETLYGIKKDSDFSVYEEYSRLWSPYRSYASRLLWKIRDNAPTNTK